MTNGKNKQQQKIVGLKCLKKILQSSVGRRRMKVEEEKKKEVSIMESPETVVASSPRMS
jgi:hypothetical protein